MVAAVCLVAMMLASACTGGGGSKSASGGEGGSPTSPTRSWAGKEPAPDFPGGLDWFNVQSPPTLRTLRGKVVLLDFWTLGCINCQHIIPDLKRLEAEFGDALVVIGVHSGKYATEHDDESIRQAIDRFGLEHPVVNDPDFAAWDAYGANAWPTLVLIDPAGKLVGGHSGEGVYSLFQPILASLIAEFDLQGAVDRTPFPLALSAQTASTVLSYPSKALPDVSRDRLFIADAGNNRILVSSLDGRLDQAIGTGKEGFADGAAGEATFRQPQGLALSPDGRTLYVADTRNHAIRAIDTTTWRVTTIAGTGQQLTRLPAANAPAKSTPLASPWDVLVTGDALFISMAGVHQIWRMDLASGQVAAFAGTSREGIADGDRLRFATLAQPSGLTTDGDNLYWVDPESSAVRRVALSGNGEVKTLVGTGLFDYGDEDGQGLEAKLQHPQGIALAGGRLIIADTYNHKLRAINLLTREVTTVAGSSERGWSDGRGEAALLDEPVGVSGSGNRVFVADQNNHLIRVLDLSSGELSTLRLSNVSVAASAQGRVTRVELPVQRVAPGEGTLRLVFKTPAGHALNSQAPSRLDLTAANPAVIEPGERAIAWSSDEPSIEVSIPARFGPGSSTLTATGAVYYCRKDEQALCYIQQVEFVLPVAVVPGAPAGEARLEYTLPVAPS